MHHCFCKIKAGLDLQTSYNNGVHDVTVSFRALETTNDSFHRTNGIKLNTIYSLHYRTFRRDVVPILYCEEFCNENFGSLAYAKPFYYLLYKIDILYIITDILYRI